MEAIAEHLTVKKWLGRWTLKSGVISIGAFSSMVSISSLLYTLTDVATGGAEESRAGISASLIFLLIHVSLFMGGMKENRLYLIPTILVSGSIIFLFFLLLFTLSLVNPLVLIISLPLTVVVYFWMVVYSYYLELDPMRAQYQSNTVISYAGAISEPTEPIKYPEVV